MMKTTKPSLVDSHPTLGDRAIAAPTLVAGEWRGYGSTAIQLDLATVLPL